MVRATTYRGQHFGQGLLLLLLHLQQPLLNLRPCCSLIAMSRTFLFTTRSSTSWLFPRLLERRDIVEIVGADLQGHDIAFLQLERGQRPRRPASKCCGRRCTWPCGAAEQTRQGFTPCAMVVKLKPAHFPRLGAKTANMVVDEDAADSA